MIIMKHIKGPGSENYRLVFEHNQFVSINRNAAVELRITMEAYGSEHKAQIIDALNQKGYKPKVVRTII